MPYDDRELACNCLRHNNVKKFCRTTASHFGGDSPIKELQQDLLALSLTSSSSMDSTSDELFALSFNQDFTCFSIGTRTEGYKLYNVESFGEIHSVPNGGYGIVEMLFCTSLVALVGLGDQPELSPRRLQIVNTKRHSTICELTFPTSILAVRMNRKRLIIILEQQIYFYDISNMKLLHTLETLYNPLAIGVLAANSDNCVFAYPAYLPHPPSLDDAPAHVPSSVSSRPLSGDVQLLDSLTFRPLDVIAAHRTPVAALSLSSDGLLLATASEKGTIIRVYNVSSSRKIYQFRRGSLPAKVQSMSFNLSVSFLTVSSDSDTVHIFKLSTDQERRQGPDEAQTSSARSSKRGTMGMIRKQSQSFGRSFAGTFGAYLPSSVSELLEPMRDFASLKIPTRSTRSLAALNPSNSHVMVITGKGEYFQYEIDYETGGECVLADRHSLLSTLE